MRIWVDGCCGMKPPITDYDRSGDLITIKALSRDACNAGWTVYTRVLVEPYMEDLDNNQFQPNQPHDIAPMIQWHKLVLKTEQIMTMTT